MQSRRDRFSFLLRLWQTDSNRAEWRASLEDPSTGERKGFADVEALLQFLKSLTIDQGEQDEPEELSPNP